eukprot:10953607-Ditylum_brightwellii.AAC.1
MHMVNDKTMDFQMNVENGVDDGVDVTVQDVTNDFVDDDHGLPNVTKSRRWLYDKTNSNDGQEDDNSGDNHVSDHFDAHVISHNIEEADLNVEDDIDDDVTNIYSDDGVDDAVDDGVDDVVDDGVTHLTHLTQKGTGCLIKRKKQNAYVECQDHGLPNVTKSRSWLYDSTNTNDGKAVDVDGNIEDGADGGVNDGVNHLTHLPQKVDCCLLKRKKETAYGECEDHGLPNVTESR